MPLATVCFHTTSPLSRSRQYAASESLEASVVETKTRSPHTAGVAALGPGSVAVQTTFSLRPHLSGNPFSSVEPLKNGPRNWGQSLATALAQERAKLVRTNAAKNAH